MARDSLDEYDEVIDSAGDSLVTAVVLLMAGIFSFMLTAPIVKIVGDIGQLPVDGNFVVLSASIVSAAVVISSVVATDR